MALLREPGHIRGHSLATQYTFGGEVLGKTLRYVIHGIKVSSRDA